MSNDVDRSGGWTCLELSCSGQQFETARLTFTRKGAFYRVTCGPLSQDEFERLKRASQTGDSIRLVFPRSRVTLSHITLECPSPGWALVEGLVLDSPTTGREGSQMLAEGALE